MDSRCKFNENFFEKIDKEENAYALGLIYSDGNIFKRDNKSHGGYAISFQQNIERKDLVYKFRDLLESKNAIQERLNGSKLCYILKVCSKKMYNDLLMLGVTPNKSLTITFPNFIKKELMPHFIRGLFDGDGCIWNGKRKKMIVKDKTRESGFRERIIHNVKFTYTSNFDFVDKMQDFLVEELGLKKNKLNLYDRRKKEEKYNTSNETCTMEYSGRGSIRKLYDYMYKDATIFSDEKKTKFEKILCALDEKSSSETELIAGNPLEP